MPPPRRSSATTPCSPGWPFEQEVLPGDRRHLGPLGCRAPGRAADDERFEAGMPARELQKTREVVHLEPAGLDLDGPFAPAPLQDAIDLERLLAPVRDALAGVPRMRQAGVLDPGTEAGRIGRAAGDALGVHDPDEGVVERHEVRRRRRPAGAAPGGARAARARRSRPMAGSRIASRTYADQRATSSCTEKAPG